jgi:hypothetical protein
MMRSFILKKNMMCRIKMHKAAVSAALTAAVMTAFILCGYKGRAHEAQVRLLFYDTDGNELTSKEVLGISEADGERCDAIMELSSMKVTREQPLHFSDAGIYCDTVQSGEAVVMNWPAESDGYILAVLDNGGKGFKSGETVNFTFQAAEDMKRRLDNAVRDRKWRTPSNVYIKRYRSAETELGIAEKADSEAVRGAYGSKAFDDLTDAYYLMLSEYGVKSFRECSGKYTDDGKWVGFTVDSVSDYKAKCDLAKKLGGDNTWIRIVFDEDTVPDDYRPLVRYASDIGISIMGLPVDSSDAKDYSTAQYLARYKQWVAAFPEINVWETGNEVNGEWTGSDMAVKAWKASEYVHGCAGKKAVMTLFYQINTADEKHSMFNWVQENVTPQMKTDIDTILISMYPEQAPAGPAAFDSVMHQVGETFPGAETGIGELGYWIDGEEQWWAFDKADPCGNAREELCERYYDMSYGYEGSIGGCFWWNFGSEFMKDKGLQEKMQAMR